MTPFSDESGAYLVRQVSPHKLADSGPTLAAIRPANTSVEPRLSASRTGRLTRVTELSRLSRRLVGLSQAASAAGSSRAA
jgi:hypothetical protein